jgi:hypothetical protein
MRADLVTMILTIVAVTVVAAGLFVAATAAIRYAARIDRQDDER